MGSISLPYTLTAGQPENVNQLNSNLNEIVNTVNGNLDATNLASNAVTTAKITDANVTKAKLATDALNTFLKLNSAADVKVAWGSSTATFAASGSASVSITHGLGSTPLIVLGAPYYTGSGLFFGFFFQGASSIGGTTFIANMQSAIGSQTGSVNFYWLAIA